MMGKIFMQIKKNCLAGWLRHALLTIGILITSTLSAQQQSLWVGQTYRCDATSAVMGLTSDVSWSTNGGYLSLTGSGFYRDVTITKYFSGTATITCSWKYRLYSGDTWKTQSRSWTVKCYDNPVSISPTEMTLSPGESAFIGHRLQYTNDYSSSASITYSSSNSSIATVSSSGLVTAKSSGTAFVTLYSSVSANSPYCTVTVKNIAPQSVSIPSNINIVAGQTKQLTANISPADATVTSIKWTTDDNSVATVSSSGVLKGVKHGTTKVRCLINGFMYSNDAIITVSKATLSLSVDKESGLITKGTTVSLITNDSRASIYYTTDGSSPTENSKQYIAPIVVDRDMTLKAIAFHKDYNNSKIIERHFEVTSLYVEKYYPENTSVMNKKDVIPVITFNSRITKSVRFDSIELKDELNTPIECDYIIADKSLYIIPTSMLDNGTYTVVIPERCVANLSNEYNTMLSFPFWVNEITKIRSSDIVDMGINYLLTDNGKLYMWGSADWYNFPEPNIKETYSPVFVMDSVQLFYGNYFIKTDNSLWGWGYNYNTSDDNILGDGTKYEKDKPVKILSDVICFEDGLGHRGALKRNGTLWLWGQNRYCQIGDGTSGTGAYKLSPTQVMSNISKFSLGALHSIALQKDGIFFGWGYGSAFGYDSNTPTPCLIATNVKNCYAGGYHNVILKDDNTLWAWGSNSLGQIGDGTTIDRNSPVKVMEDVEKCYASDCGTFALKSDGSLYRWGIVGSSHATLQNSPVLIMDDVKDFHVTNENIYVLKKNKTLWSCGTNLYGNLGNGTQNDSYDSFCFTIDEVEIVWPHRYGCYVLRADGCVYGWGTRIGNGTNSIERTPVKLFDNNITDIESVKLLNDKYSVAVDEKILMQLSINPSNATYETIEWQSLDESIATVSQRGVVTGVSEGDTEIKVTLTIDDDVFVASGKVYVTAAVGIKNITIPNLRVWASKGTLHLEGVPIGDNIRVYNSIGTMLINTSAKMGHITIPITDAGLYIVRVGKGFATKIIAKE